MKIERVWAMPNKWTFSIRPIAALVGRYLGDGGTNWADPFAGTSRLAEYRNDLNPEHGQDFSMEAYEFMELFRGAALSGVIFDPPYSLTQVSRSYKEIGVKYHNKEDPTGGFTKVRNAIQAAIRPAGHCISFGWNTVGMGKKRGFEIDEILIVCHGGKRNDTLVTVERRL